MLFDGKQVEVKRTTERSFSRYVMIGGNEMYICLGCDKTFEKPLESGEQELCPHCFTQEFSEARQCDDCGVYVPEDDINYHEESDSHLCDECYRSEVNKLSPREEYELSEFLRGWESLHSYA